MQRHARVFLLFAEKRLATVSVRRHPSGKFASPYGKTLRIALPLVPIGEMTIHSPPLLTSVSFGSERFSAGERTKTLGRRIAGAIRGSQLDRQAQPRHVERAFLGKSYPTLRQARPRGVPEAAMRVRKISAQCVLQFTPSLAAGCVLHRPVSRVIHCSELSFFVGNLTEA